MIKVFTEKKWIKCVHVLRCLVSKDYTVQMNQSWTRIKCVAGCPVFKGIHRILAVLPSTQMGIIRSKKVNWNKSWKNALFPLCFFWNTLLEQFELNWVRISSQSIYKHFQTAYICKQNCVIIVIFFFQQNSHHCLCPVL